MLRKGATVMAHIPRPYVGVKGFTNGEQVKDTYFRIPPPLLIGRDLMVEVHIDLDTVSRVTPDARPRYPTIEKVGEIFLL
jgi:hypothetical protein